MHYMFDIDSNPPPLEGQITFPLQNLIGFKFNDLKELRQKLNSEARQRKQQQMSTWFYLSGQSQNFTVMKCNASNSCKAYIRMIYINGDGFTVQSVTNKHNHDGNKPLQQLKQHHIIAPFLIGYKPLKSKLSIGEGTYRIKTNCCCKNNPGESAIAYSILSPTNETVLENSYKFQNFTNNKAQFTVVIFALLDCEENGISTIQVHNRSKLLVDFMNGMSKISAPVLQPISEALKLVSSRLPAKITYKILPKNQGSIKLQNLCRKLLELQEVETR